VNWHWLRKQKWHMQRTELCARSLRDLKRNTFNLKYLPGSGGRPCCGFTDHAGNNSRRVSPWSRLPPSVMNLDWRKTNPWKSKCGGRLRRATRRRVACLLADLLWYPQDKSWGGHASPYKPIVRSMYSAKDLNTQSLRSTPSASTGNSTHNHWLRTVLGCCNFRKKRLICNRTNSAGRRKAVSCLWAWCSEARSSEVTATKNTVRRVKCFKSQECRGKKGGGLSAGNTPSSSHAGIRTGGGTWILSPRNQERTGGMAPTDT